MSVIFIKNGWISLLLILTYLFIKFLVWLVRRGWKKQTAKIVKQVTRDFWHYQRKSWINDQQNANACDHSENVLETWLFNSLEWYKYLSSFISCVSDTVQYFNMYKVCCCISSKLSHMGLENIFVARLLLSVVLGWLNVFPLLVRPHVFPWWPGPHSQS